MVTNNLGDLLITAIINAVPIIWPIFRPYVYGAIAVSIIGFALSRVAYHFCILGGSSPRKAKKIATRFKDFLGLFSSLGDIYKK